MTRIDQHISDTVWFDPKHVLAGMGFKLIVRSSLLDGTPFVNVAFSEWQSIYSLFEQEGKHLIRPLVALLRGEPPDPNLDGRALERLEELGVVESVVGAWRLVCSGVNDLGTTFEWLVASVLADLGLAAHRRCHLETDIENIANKVQGADWDILATFKFNQLMWVECKFGHVADIDDIRKFQERSRVLNPDLAIYLLNTDQHYGPTVRAALGGGIRNPPRVDVMDVPTQVVASAFPNRYFLRVHARQDSRWTTAIKSGIQEVLYRHHARMQRIVYDEKSWLR